ncbi:MAG TPA: LLM class flavin-dependent oxidoreductase [Myxococcota bacterium]|jgi:alkanesulfonate monooxygenase SsuD/methylene tetrahydromethanopterin reductase-like flavin-dependent oxidoreductase (luciferase family)|nr:LLM class flavin-dependent oxidoreductase [Myxococcota bacterium]
MKIDLFAMPAVPATLEERERLRPVGRSTERYQRMLEELRHLCILADELGIDAFSTTEHHFHTEGNELSVNPVLLFADFAARTKRILMMPMSIVMTAANPIRVAEDLAILDQLTKGRVAVAFARGYQKRWMQVLGQGGTTATGMGDSADQANRERFDEGMEILEKAWKEDCFEYNGKHFQVPYPYEKGIEGWAAAHYTRKFGAEGELDANGVIRKIGVCPRPYQEPHPLISQPVTGGMTSLLSCAKHGWLPWIWEGDPPKFLEMCRTYQRVAAEHGHPFALGQNAGCVRAICIGDTREEAFELAAKTTGYSYQEYFGHFGFLELFRNPEDDPNVRPWRFKSNEDAVKRMIEKKYQLCGTVDDIKREMEPLVRCYADGDLEWLSWNFFCQGTTPRHVQDRQLELFATKVMPEFK